MVRNSPDVGFRYSALFSCVLIVVFVLLNTLNASAIRSKETFAGSEMRCCSRTAVRLRAG